MKFKKEYIKLEFDSMPLILHKVFADFEFMSRKFRVEPTITRILGKIKGDSGVHAAYRAIDVRDEYLNGLTYTLDQRQALFYYINALYPRKDSYLTIKWHRFKDSRGKEQPGHFHIQVPAVWVK